MKTYMHFWNTHKLAKNARKCQKCNAFYISPNDHPVWIMVIEKIAGVVRLMKRLIKPHSTHFSCGFFSPRCKQIFNPNASRFYLWWSTLDMCTKCEEKSVHSVICGWNKKNGLSFHLTLFIPILHRWNSAPFSLSPSNHILLFDHLRSKFDGKRI